jgi:DNA-binding response OmpR family regulator
MQKGQGKPAILIVEDDPGLALGLVDTLEFEGFDVVHTTSGRESIKLAEARNFDCVILDVMLPDMNGFQVCSEIRLVDPIIPILMLTARSQEVDKIRGLDVGRRRLRDKAVQRRRAHRAHPRASFDARRVPAATQRGDVHASGEATVDLSDAHAHRTRRHRSRSSRSTRWSCCKLCCNVAHRRSPCQREEILEKIWGVSPQPVEPHRGQLHREAA